MKFYNICNVEYVKDDYETTTPIGIYFKRAIDAKRYVLEQLKINMKSGVYGLHMVSMLEIINDEDIVCDIDEADTDFDKYSSDYFAEIELRYENSYIDYTFFLIYPVYLKYIKLANKVQETSTNDEIVEYHAELCALNSKYKELLDYINRDIRTDKEGYDYPNSISHATTENFDIIVRENVLCSYTGKAQVLMKERKREELRERLGLAGSDGP